MRFASRAPLGAIALLLVVAACSDRPRTNPLDPRNPETGGGPITFRALAGESKVDLEWSPAPPASDISAFRLERRRHGPDPFQEVVPPLPANSTGFEDLGVTDGFEYDYRLTFLLASGDATGTPIERMARPGREILWVADPGADQVARMTPDGRERRHTIVDVLGVNRTSVQLNDGTLWVTEPAYGRVRTFAVDGTGVTSFGGLDDPNAIAVDAATSTAWICEELPGAKKVRRFDASGNALATTPALGLPSDVAVIAGGGAWIVDQENAAVVRVSASGSIASTTPLGGDPRRVAYDALDGSAWVTCLGSGEVVHVRADGSIAARYPGFEGPYGIDVDELRGQVWVGLDDANAVCAISRANGTRLFTVNAIPRPRGLAVADNTGECWVTAIATHELVQISSTGAVGVRNSNFDAPFDVEIDPGPRP